MPVVFWNYPFSIFIFNSQNIRINSSFVNLDFSPPLDLVTFFCLAFTFAWHPEGLTELCLILQQRCFVLLHHFLILVPKKFMNMLHIHFCSALCCSSPSFLSPSKMACTNCSTRHRNNYIELFFCSLV